MGGAPALIFGFGFDIDYRDPLAVIGPRISMYVQYQCVCRLPNTALEQ